MRYLSLNQVKAVLAEAISERERLAFLVAFLHGLRASEICSLTGRQIQDGQVDVQRLKNSKHTIQLVVRHPDPELDESRLLRKLASEVAPDERLFPWSRFQFYRRFKRAATAAGVPVRNPHCLKHSIGKLLSKQKVEIENVQQWLGHKDIKSTAEYLKTNDQEAAASVFAAVGARTEGD